MVRGGYHPITDLKPLIRRVVEIDYLHHHRHAPSSLSALPVVAAIYDGMGPDDVFILSKGHAAAALYAVLEAHGFHPDITKVHPERDPANGVDITSGSLGHGLPIAVGMAWAKQMRGEPGTVHVLMGDGECQEGTTWEALNLARRLCLDNLEIHIDWNGRQCCDLVLVDCREDIAALFPEITIHKTVKGGGVKLFEKTPWKSTHLITAADYAAIMEELK